MQRHPMRQAGQVLASVAEHCPCPAAEYAVTNTTAPFTIAFTEGMAKLYAYFLGRNEDGVRWACLQQLQPYCAASYATALT